MLVFYCEYKKQGRVARKITKIGRNPAEKERLNHNKTKKQKVTIKVDYILLASICN